MVKSKEWDWRKLNSKEEEFWLEPSLESYYLVNRWQRLDKKDFLDLGCGLGRHTILFAQNGFNTHGFDLSKEAVNDTEKYAKKYDLDIECKIGDMLSLPYEDASFDAILCYNVISHTDTVGVKKVIEELKRILKADGEVYLTLCSKETWGFKQTDWPMVDPNTRIRMDDGPEKGIPHFYADYELIKELFKDFKIVKLFHLQDFYEKDGQVKTSYHYHLLIKKVN